MIVRMHFFVGGITDRVCLVSQTGPCLYNESFSPISKLGLLDAKDSTRVPAHLGRRTSLGVHPVGWTALCLHCVLSRISAFGFCKSDLNLPCPALFQVFDFRL